ncbi:MAG: DUF3737 family protein [Oscillospiraceae bacterium]|jgi:hypothetical protein|nr:DUF3737 family protein [Oscillospiraceae bacterium]
MELYENLTLDEERALYAATDAEVRRCLFDGPADGESALKESRRIRVEDCDFHLRYPLWHVKKGTVIRCRMTDTSRAALWYDEDVTLEGCELGGIKALRECDRTVIRDCRINSQEFGWLCRGAEITDTELVSEYPFFMSRGLRLKNFHLTGKYSFQYVEDAVIEDSVLDTKDAFWHSKNITVIDSVVKGEYLAWYSENLKLIRCKIIGTQPLCYAKGLVLEDCEMEGTDLSFEYSEVNATVRGSILSVKNPAAGRIEADSIGEVILDDHQVKDGGCRIEVR